MTKLTPKRRAHPELYVALTNELRRQAGDLTMGNPQTSTATPAEPGKPVEN
jgi:hypothetical protein